MLESTYNLARGQFNPKLGVIALGLSVFWAPILLELSRKEWSTEQGAHGPLILVTSLWLLRREVAASRAYADTGKVPILILMLSLTFPLYLLGSWAGIAWIGALGALLSSLAILYFYVGYRLIKRVWFSVIYLFFIIPPPITLTSPFIRSARLSISTLAVDLLSWLGYEVANSGASIFIDQYEVAVAAACAGLNSIVSLQAVGLLYVFLAHRANWKYCLLLSIMIFPIAIFSNFVRVIMLLLATHYGGEAFAQGLFHEAAGLTMFLITLVSLVILDNILSPLFLRTVCKGPAVG